MMVRAVGVASTAPDPVEEGIRELDGVPVVGVITKIYIAQLSQIQNVPIVSSAVWPTYQHHDCYYYYYCRCCCCCYGLSQALPQ
jgi:hypothetical protein